LLLDYASEVFLKHALDIRGTGVGGDVEFEDLDCAGTVLRKGAGVQGLRRQAEEKNDERKAGGRKPAARILFRSASLDIEVREKP
jgi:hypothetical protein